jgi:predicted glycoside hydrolase/deacetylase ChbG (UPF0249 family)
LILDILSANFRARAKRLGVRTNPAFAGAYDWSKPSNFGRRMAGFVEKMPDGGVIMCHPGYVDDELRRIDGLTEMREAERSFLASEDFRTLLSARGLTLS